MKTTKLKLASLNVKSFATGIEKKEIKGGAGPTELYGCSNGLSCVYMCHDPK